MYNRDLSQSVFLGLIGCMSFTGNMVFVVLIVTSRSLLKNAYNTMVLSLAFTDMLTGILIFLTPSYVIRQHYPLPPPGHGGFLFCYLIRNQFMTFTLGIVSLYTVTLLGLERWFAVFKPLYYRKTFHSSRVKKYLCIVWSLAFAANGTHLTETKYTENPFNETGPALCEFSPWTESVSREIIGVVEFLVKFVSPVVIMVVTYTYLYAFGKTAVPCITLRSQIALRRVTFMAAVTAAVMVVCWLPNQVYYLCYKFNLVDLKTNWHKFTIIFCMLNSCVNPCIFLLSNKIYRHKLSLLARKCTARVWSRYSNEKIPGTQDPAVICMKHVKFKKEPSNTIEYILKVSTEPDNSVGKNEQDFGPGKNHVQ